MTNNDVSIINDSGILIKIFVIIRAFAPFCGNYRLSIFDLFSQFRYWNFSSWDNANLKLISFLQSSVNENANETIIILMEIFLIENKFNIDATIIDIALDFHRNNYYRH